MNRHQVLTGAVNAGDACYSVGSVEGIFFTAYAAGCNIVILASDFQRVQIIPGVTHGNIQVSCVDCCSDTGKIAASYDQQILIFEPTPLLRHNNAHRLDYQWYKTASFNAECHVITLSWNLEGTRLLTAGGVLQLWHSPDDSEAATYHSAEASANTPNSANRVGFMLGGEDVAEEEDELSWRCIWRCATATPTHYLKFSPDGLLFATSGKNDRLVKVWYESRKSQVCQQHVSRESANDVDDGGVVPGIPSRKELDYCFCYLAHPNVVTGFSWRRTSKYMPKGTVTNVLMTWSRDNICRLWNETVLPDDGLVDLQQFDLSTTNDPKLTTQRHKKRFVQKLSHIRHVMQKRRKQKKDGQPHGVRIQSMASSASMHDFHKYWVHQNGLTPILHFHLAAVINPDTDIPAMPSPSSYENNFVVHWLNNKELLFTLESERLMHELNVKAGNLIEESSAPAQSSEDHDSGPDIVQHGDAALADKKRKHVMWNLLRSNSRLDDSSANLHRISSEVSGRNGSGLPQSASQVSMDDTATANSPQWLIGASDHDRESIYYHSSLKLASDDAFDRRIETMLKTWHQSPDLLFSVHPGDGSFLVWSVEWLDEVEPGCFRQAQVSFSSRIPRALPLGDAVSMATNVVTYCTTCLLDVGSCNTAAFFSSPAAGSGAPSAASSIVVPHVLMLTKHLNGSLNLWKMNFGDDGGFRAVVSVTHSSRACGHRFRTNCAACHPVLPLLITTSHHNIPQNKNRDSSIKSGHLTPKLLKSRDSKSTFDPATGFCSELILWRVDAVGPLSKTGGITELAKISSPSSAAFDNVAWLPTLLPASALGTHCNSPSSLFVASDGRNLRLYQAVVDARSILTEANHRFTKMGGSLHSDSSSYPAHDSGNGIGSHPPTANCNRTGEPVHCYSIVSEQSTSRPGCIFELDVIKSAQHKATAAGASQDWTSTQLLHVFHHQLITGRSQEEETDLNFGGDLLHSSSFMERYYLVVLEKTEGYSVLHMWKIVISSLSASVSTDDGLNKKSDNLPTDGPSAGTDSSLEDDASSDTSSEPQFDTKLGPQFRVQTDKVYCEKLNLPDGVEVLYATAAAGQPSSSTIYPACFAPYLIVTACSDGFIRFWNCSVNDDEKYFWLEWAMAGDDSSIISVPGRPITVSCAYTGRIAIAYRFGTVRAARDDPHSKFVNLYVSVYECESTGGCEWNLEDTIELKNIFIPDAKAEIDLSCILGNERKISTVLSSENFFKMQLSSHSSPHDISPVSSVARMPHVPSIPSLSTIQRQRRSVAAAFAGTVPSYSTIHSVKKSIAEKGNKSGILVQKHLVQLDWAPMENGSHILTIAVGSKIIFFSPVNGETTENSLNTTNTGGGETASTPSMGSFTSTHGPPLLQKTISMTTQDCGKVKSFHWLRLRSVELSTADNLPPLPMHVSWAKDGVLIVGMDNEMHVYSQWQGPQSYDDVSSLSCGRRPPPAELVAAPSGTSFRSGTSTYGDAAMAGGRRPGAAAAGGPPKLSAQRISQSVPHLHRMMSASKLSAIEKRLDAVATGSTKRRSTTTSLGAAERAAATTDALPPLANVLQLHMEECGLFEAAQFANPVLPQYHPKQLLELLNFGKVKRVKAILAHLVHCIAGEASAEDDIPDHTRPRSLSIHRVKTQGKVEVHEEQPGFVEITSIPPLPLFALLAADKDSWAGDIVNTEGTATGGSAIPSAKDGGYDELFSEGYSKSSDDLDLTLDEDGTDSADDTSSVKAKASARPRSASVLSSGLAQRARLRNNFGPSQSVVLSGCLMHVQLPGLSHLDQMYLMALSDTVAHTHMDFSEKFSQDKAPASDVDDCGLRYMVAVRRSIYLQLSLPPTNRLQMQKAGLPYADVIWGFHSESQNELLKLLPSVQKGQPSWQELRQYGFGWMVHNVVLLRTCVEQVAKAAFQKNSDPLDAALFYLAMKKKNVLWGLYRSIKDEKMTEFFKNDFTKDRWRKAALKNAFALLGRQRFEHAAAFFLLAGGLKDAVEICITHLDDVQLALVIARLYESDVPSASGIATSAAEPSQPASAASSPLPPTACSLVLREVLGGEERDVDHAHPDPFLRSMAYWLIREYDKALGTLLETGIGYNHPKYEADANVSVFNFYNYLRSHPLIVRQQLAKHASIKGLARSALLPGFSRGALTVSGADDTDGKTVILSNEISSRERQLFFQTAHAHFKLGCPALALEVLTKLPQQMANMFDTNVPMPGTTSSSKIAATGGNTMPGGSNTDSGASNRTSFNSTTGKPRNNSVSTSDHGEQPKPASAADTADSFDWGSSLARPYDSYRLDEKDEETPDGRPMFSVASSSSSNSEDGSSGDSSDDEGDASSVESRSRLKDSGETRTRDEGMAKEGKSAMASEATLSAAKGTVDDEQPQRQTQLAGPAFDVMAQQLKFIACLKIAMEELSTLATGFEVDGGQLRYQLYIWLEKEVEVLRTLCNYGRSRHEIVDDGSTGAIADKPLGGPALRKDSTDADTNAMPASTSEWTPHYAQRGRSASGISAQLSAGASSNLHEVIQADRLDFEAKQLHMARRKKWLKANQQLLRTLLNYCALYGASGGGGLACVRMELILLMQELQQERTQKQLLSPLPFPTTLPLLSASIASSKTVIIDPVTYLQNSINDIMQTMAEYNSPPNYTGRVTQAVTLRNLATSLSSCIYECLCDSDSITVAKADCNDAGLEGFTNTAVVYKDSFLMTGARKRHHTSDPDEVPTSMPSKWPGVTELIALLIREREADATKLNVLLCEALFSMYLSLLIHALTFYECNILFRLVTHSFTDQMWSALFGGGVKKLVTQRGSFLDATHQPQPSSLSPSAARQRINMHQKLLNQAARASAVGGNASSAPGRPGSSKPMYQEKFVPPRVSMVNYFMSRPAAAAHYNASVGYDSEASVGSDEEDESTHDADDSDVDSGKESKDANRNAGKSEHVDPGSYSWSLMRLAIVKRALANMRTLLPTVGIELSDVPAISPLLHSVLKIMELWQTQMTAVMDAFKGPPPNYLPRSSVDYTSVEVAAKYRVLLQPDNTPFRSLSHSALPCRRLWSCLISQDLDTFVQYIFKRRTAKQRAADDATTYTAPHFEPSELQHGKIIHRDQDIVSAFCINQAVKDKIALATHKEIIELDIQYIMKPLVTYDDGQSAENGGLETTSLQVAASSANANKGENSDFVYVDKRQQDAAVGSALTSAVSSYGLTGRGVSLIMKRSAPDVKKMGSHPKMPYYLAGSNDGSVRMYEWGHAQPVYVPRAAGNFPKVTKVLFNAHGNKFGVTDNEGSLALWQVAFGSNVNAPYLTLPCHSKSAHDFAFVSSNSVIVTAGLSSDGNNVCFWDTLLPRRCSLVQAFNCHEHGASALVYAPQHQLIISSGKKGDVCVFDARQRQLLQQFQAHNSAVRCIALDPCEELFATGSADGDIKVWGLSVHNLIKTYKDEHSKTSMFNKSVGGGVLQLAIGGDRGCLYSCGADGTMKVRLMGDKDFTQGASMMPNASSYGQLPVLGSGPSTQSDINFSTGGGGGGNGKAVTFML